MGLSHADCKTALRRAAAGGLALALALAAGCASPGVTAANRNAQGVEQFSSGRYDDAIVLFQAALDENPDSAETYYNLGSAYQRKAAETGDVKLLDQAEDAYWTALGLNPEPETIVCCYRGLATSSTARGDAVGAQEILQQWRDRNPDSIEPKLEIAYLLEAQDKDAEAYKLLQEVAQEAPGDYRAYYKMGTISERAGDLSDAIENVNVAIKLNPDDSRLVQRANALEAQYLAQQRIKANEAKEKDSPKVPESDLNAVVVDDVPADQMTQVQSTSAAQFEDASNQSASPATSGASQSETEIEIQPQTQPATSKPMSSQTTPSTLGRSNDALGFGNVVASSNDSNANSIRQAQALTTSPARSSSNGEPEVKWLGSVAAAPESDNKSDNKIAQTSALVPKRAAQDSKSVSNGLGFANLDADGSGVGKPIPNMASAASASASPSASPSQPVAAQRGANDSPYAARATIAKPAAPPVVKPRAQLNSGPPNLRAGSVF